MARLDADEDLADPVIVENAGGSGGFVLVCDHASNRFPGAFGFLGLPPAAREAHIAWDPGALGVSRHLSRLLDSPLVHSTVSRLVIDCNRDPEAPDAIVEESVASGIAVPGNANLRPEERRRRVAAVHAPYHEAIDAVIERRLAAGMPTALVAIHSFTRSLGGVSRPWEVGVVFDKNRLLAKILIAGFESAGLNAGVNEPYSPADRVYYTLSRHAESRGLDCVMIEIRNDLIRADRTEKEWAERIAGILAPAAAGRTRRAAG